MSTVQEKYRDEFGKASVAWIGNRFNFAGLETR